jgi:hypothetical protein
VRLKVTVSGLYLAFAGVITTLTVFMTFGTGSATVITRVWGYGAVVTVMVVVPTGIESYGIPSRRFTSFIRTPFLKALPAAAWLLCDTEYMSAASDETATPSSTIATMISTRTKPLRGPLATIVVLVGELAEFRSDIVMVI